MKEYTAVPFHPKVNTIAEGVLWDQASNCLLWVDIEEGQVFEYYPQDEVTEIYEVDDYATTVVLWETDTLLVSGQRNLYLLHRKTKEKSLFLTIPNIPNEYRLNDGKLDPMGRLIIGTMLMTGSKAEGELFCITRDKQITPILGGIGCSNGICFTEDSKIMYYIDTPKNRVDAFRFNLATGEISDRVTAVDTSDFSGLPDGMTMDKKGMIWVAMFGGYSVLCFDPKTSELLALVNLPVEKVTSCTFGSNNTLYISTVGCIYCVEID